MKNRTTIIVIIIAAFLLCVAGFIVELSRNYQDVRKQIAHSKENQLVIEHLKAVSLYSKKVNYPVIFRAVNKWADEYKIDPMLIHSIIIHESEYQKNAVSVVGAVGLMQVYLEVWGVTLSGDKIKCIYDESVNIEIGCWILSYHMEQNPGNLLRAIIEYNGGRVRKCDTGKYQTNAESQLYAERVIQTYYELRSRI